MSFGFGNVNTKPDKQWLREAGVHENAKFLDLRYDATEQYEYFDIEIETAEGRFFRERTFGPNKEKVFPKDKYKNKVKVGTETKEEAFERVQQEINTKLFYLASCFCDKQELTEKASKVKDLKGLVEVVRSLIGQPTDTINFLTIWKNNDAKKKSNLIIADKIKWCEKHTEGRKAAIQLNRWQIANNTVEKYPYVGNNSEENNDSLVGSGEVPAGAVDDLPF